MTFSCGFVTPPKRIYKYVSAERCLQMLRTNTIRFTQPEELNDPFEFCPSLDLELLKKEYLSAPKRKSAIKAGTDDKILMKDFKDHCLEVARAISQLNKSTGVLSLSESADVPLMWSHYAEEHSGFVIGLDANSLISRGMPKDKSGVYGIGPVNYRSTRARFPVEHGSNFDFMLIKDSCWSYEHEWRIVRGLASLNKVSDSVYVDEIPASSILCVIRGARSDKKHVREMLDILREDKYKHVHQYAAYPHADEFSIDIGTHVGEMLGGSDDHLEEQYTPGVLDLYKFASKGRLFGAMGMVDVDDLKKHEKHEFGF